MLSNPGPVARGRKFVNDQIQAVAYKARGQSYWIARYRHRDDIYEWECDWGLVPRKGLTALVLQCPNGNWGVLENKGGNASDRLFQFKIATAEVSMGGPHCIGVVDTKTGRVWGWDPVSKLPVLGSMPGRKTLAHVIGIVNGLDGEAIMWSWEYHNHRLVGPFEDNVSPGRMNYGGGVTQDLYYDVLGIKPD